VVVVGIVVVVVTVEVGEVMKPVTVGKGGSTTVVVMPLLMTTETEEAAAARAGRTEAAVMERMLILRGS